MKEEILEITDEEIAQVSGGKIQLPHRPQIKPADPNDPNDRRNWKRNPNPNGPPYILPPGCACSWVKEGGHWVLIA